MDLLGCLENEAWYKALIVVTCLWKSVGARRPIAAELWADQSWAEKSPLVWWDCSQLCFPGRHCLGIQEHGRGVLGVWCLHYL